MLEKSVKVHDRFQIEIKLDYKIGDFGTPKSYDVAAYFFVPLSLGVTPKAYSRQDFYGDLLSRIRIKTPVIPLQNFINGISSPLIKLSTAVKNVAQRPTRVTNAEFEYHLKMFCCILKSALRDQVQSIRTRKSAVDVNGLVTQFCVETKRICDGLRNLRALLNAPHVSEKTFAKYLFADEFMSLTVEWYAFQLLETLRTTQGRASDPQRQELFGIVQDEIAYRKANSYPSIPEEGAANEELVFRKSVLKKYVENVLFLMTRSKREGTIAEQTAIAIAAGLSMVFATAIAFLVQRRFGNLTFPFFVALVISYMFKDRIKEGLRSVFNTKLRRFFFDRRTSIFNLSDDSREKEPIGVCRESVEFQRENKLPGDVWKLRDRDHITEVENGWLGETVILYRKRIRLYPSWFQQVQDHYPVEGINDIMRVNFSKFLARMDNPKKPLWLTDGQEYREIEGDRVYHINVVLEYKVGRSVEAGRFRIVLNKDGIKRVEPVVAVRPSFPSAPDEDWGD